MSDAGAGEQARVRTAELQATHRRLALEHADAEERAGEVHEEVARVHEGLGDRSLLDPEELRRHAQAGRDRAARERERAAGDPQGPT